MSAVIGNPLLLSPEGYQISRSVRLRSSASAYFNRTPASAGNRKTWTWSGWVKRARTTSSVPDEDRLFNVTGAGTDTTLFSILFDASTAKLAVVTGATTFRVTSAAYRDPSAWYHIVVALDTTQATAANRLRLYVNGSEVTAFDTNNAPTQNTDYGINQGSVEHFIGRYTATTPNRYFEGYITEVNFIDGQALTPASFGETNAVTGVWKPKRYTGTYGTNGFYLNFSDNSAATAAAIGKDYSGNGNNWTPNNISVTAGVTYDSMLDVPTMWADGGNGRGNYATLNPATWLRPVLSDGNLTTSNATVNNLTAGSTIGVTSGKWYWEMRVFTGGGATSYPIMGIVKDTFIGFNTSNAYPGLTADSWGLFCNTGQFRNNNATVATYSTIANGDTCMFALDMDNGRYYMGKNGTWFNSGDPANGTGSILSSGLVGSIIFAAVGEYNGTSTNANFGQRPFAYTPPTGFKALNTQNLPTPTILKGNQYFDVVTRNGFGSSGGSITSLQFQPDLLWEKARNVVSNHNLIDSVRGVSQLLQSSNTNAEVTNSTFLTSFNSNGYTFGSGDFATTTTLVDWVWKEGATQGFDIVTYTGTGANRTVAHNLGVAPRMIIVKNRTDTDAGSTWVTGHQSIGWGNFLNLNDTAASAAAATVWQSTAPTSSVFSLGTSVGVNENTKNFVAYLFAEVAGFSRFGSISANGAADNAFVFTGFLPRFVMLKRTDSTSNWIIWDTARNTYNVLGEELYPNLSNAASTVTDLDVLSNGFKLRNSAFTGTWIYAAFASSPFKNSLAF